MASPKVTPDQRLQSIKKYQEVLEGLPKFREPPSFSEYVASDLIRILLWVICGLVLVFLIIWAFTRPTVDQVRALVGSAADAKMLLEALSSLQRDHFDQFNRLFQLLVLSGLVPLFTLLAGYAFGSRQRQKAKEQE
jgi:hypothetical protein